MSRSVFHLPAVLSDEFNIPRSEARRRIALGRVKVNGEVVTDLDVDLNKLAPGKVQIEMDCHPQSDAIAQMLAAQANALAQGFDEDA